MAVQIILEFIGALLLGYALLGLRSARCETTSKTKVKAFWRRGTGYSYMSSKGGDIWLNGMILTDAVDLPSLGETVWLREIGGRRAMKGIVRNCSQSPVQIQLARMPD